ncbi:MAG TPA: enoyl-CoA hydratase/isomerase [Chitinophaga sp.]|uniref:enoyl-CoA hydratase/isomerase n=1 Tax=Chitinophaga sp. TaxID=1869181 RepID=UPI002BFFB674|nr:enoyl-CoA hydratase/isomerase [Chitinophaga sp.]HVI45326.1 enoyl-CoA hydratase/isomerase [Chitinophaga sp.]
MHTVENKYNTIKVHEQRGVCYLQIYRPESANSINGTLIEEMMTVLHLLEKDPTIKVVVLEGLPDNFCTGMDFTAISNGMTDAIAADDPNGFYEMLKWFSLCPQVIISKVEGRVNAGGIGLIAASDIVIADKKAIFSLSEALFGLLPACVMPFLIRRIGYQKAQWMTLTTQSLTAEQAYQINLIDELTTNVNDMLRRNLLRLQRLDTDTIKNLKDYMSRLWIINQDTQQLAVDKISALVCTEKVQTNIKNFVQNGKFPWDK